MPDYTIETTYHLPVFRHRTYTTKTPEAACRAAIEDDDWDKAKQDHESSGEVYVTGIWEGTHAAYSGSASPVPTHFGEAIQRKAGHFEILLGVLKIIVDDFRANRVPSADWLQKAFWAIARGEAILAGTDDPDEPVGIPRSRHILATLQEDRVRDAVADILKIDRNFKELAPDAVTGEEIHAACLTIATTMDFSDQVGTAEFQAALAAIREARRRLGS